jgi:hypothetical protein
MTLKEDVDANGRWVFVGCGKVVTDLWLSKAAVSFPDRKKDGTRKAEVSGVVGPGNVK